MSNSKIFLQTHVDHYHDDVRDRPVIRIFGTEKNGTPVLCHVHGFFPYFYVDHYQIEKLLEIKGFTDLFSASFNTQYKKNKLLAVEIVEKQSVYNYSDGKTKFLKLVFNNVSSIKQVKSFLESGIVLNGRRFMFRVYENHVAYVLRFMIDKNMYGMSYVEAKNFDWIECDRVNEISVDVSDLNCVAHAGEFEKLPPLKILSFDIECIGPTDAFPTAKEDPVIQIGNTTAVSNDYDNVQKTIFTLGSCAPIPGANMISFDDEKKLIESWRDYFVNEDPDIVIGYNIKNFDFPYLQDRAHILQIENFASVGRSSRPMKIRDQVFSSRQVGNRASKEIEIDGRIIFDMLSVIRRDFNLRSYTLNSVSVHFLKEQKEDVPYSSMRSLQQGDQETRKRIATYCLRDTYLPLRLFKILNVLANYSEMARVTGVPIEYLSTRGQAIKVLSQILRKAKEEGYVLPQISPSGDERSFEGGFVMAPEKGFYASPIAVLDFSSLYPSIMIVHNLCYTTLLTKKQVDAIYRKFGRRAGEPENGAKTDREDNFIFACSKSESTLECSANKTRSLNSASKENKSISKIDDDSFEIGDFSAEENLEDFISNEKNKNDDEKNASNYSTNNNISNGDFNMESFYNLGDLRPEDIEQSPSGNYFVKESKKKGLLPVILTSLISERKKTKKMLANTQDPELRSSLNARQLALKVSANSVYGFTGAAQGQLPCLEISQSVTSFGREMIASTKRLIEDKYSKKAGFTHDSRVIYGDTDSVMINFNEEDLKKVFELSNTVASYVSSTFIKPISLEFEKVYYPYLLMNKKRYAGLIYTNPQKPDKIDTKGIETVRRDNCEMVRTVVETCLDLILMKKDVEGAKNFVKNTVRDLYLNKIDLSQLVISKALTKEGSKYASKQAHVELAQKLKQRDAGNAPMLGDRIGYIIVKGSKGMAAYERSEDPVYVLENNIPIDTEYYLENQLSKPIYRLFEPILQNVMELTRGEHTRTVNISLPSKGPLTTFLTKKTLCIGCKTPGKILCNICMCNFSKHFLSLQKTFDEQKAVFAKCWTECQRCQGSVVNEILCVNRDCPIFYKRTKVKKDLVDLEEKYNSLKNFDW